MWRCSGLPASSGSSRRASMPTMCRRTTPPLRWRRPSPDAGTEAQEPFTGRSNLHALSPGVAIIDPDRVIALNRLHESLTLATVAPFETVARPDAGHGQSHPLRRAEADPGAGAGLIGGEPLVMRQALHGAARRARHHHLAADQAVDHAQVGAGHSRTPAGARSRRWAMSCSAGTRRPRSQRRSPG